MPVSIARQIIDFIFSHNPSELKKNISFSGGEPLLEFDVLKEIISLIENHPAYDSKNVTISLITNGTIFSPEIAEFLKKHSVQFSVSCDGPPSVHDLFRKFPDGSGSSPIVERTITQALEVFSSVKVHAVYHPKTIRALPSMVDYLSSLGFSTVSVNPDFTAAWTLKEARILPEVYGKIAEKHIASSLRRGQYIIDFLDRKMHIILGGGYTESQKCGAGRGTLAFDHSGNIYACEKMIGLLESEDQRIGSVRQGVQAEPLHMRRIPEHMSQAECLFCSIKDYCMHWCFCANYFSSGYINRTGPFLCYHEKATVQAVLNTLQMLQKTEGRSFPVHLRSYLPS